MEFEVVFSDDDVIWKHWDQDLATTVQFEDYCRENPELHLLLFTVRRTAAESKVLRDQQITLVQPGDIVFVDICSLQYDFTMIWMSMISIIYDMSCAWSIPDGRDVISVASMAS